MLTGETNCLRWIWCRFTAALQRVCTKADGKKVVLRDLYRSGVAQVGVTNFAVINGKLEENFGNYDL